MPSDQLRTNRHPTATTPSSPHSSRTCHALLLRAEWMPSKYKCRVPRWHSVATSVETETDECPWPLRRYRLLRGLRPCSQDLREKNTPRQNAVAEAGSETINLILQFRQHVYVGS